MNGFVNRLVQIKLSPLDLMPEKSLSSYTITIQAVRFQEWCLLHITAVCLELNRLLHSQ